MFSRSPTGSACFGWARTAGMFLRRDPTSTRVVSAMTGGLTLAGRPVSATSLRETSYARTCASACANAAESRRRRSRPAAGDRRVGRGLDLLPDPEQQLPHLEKPFQPDVADGGHRDPGDGGRARHGVWRDRPLARLGDGRDLSAARDILLTNHHWSTSAALAATFGLGLGIGLLQGAITVVVGVPFVSRDAGRVPRLGRGPACADRAGGEPARQPTTRSPQSATPTRPHGGVASLRLSRSSRWPRSRPRGFANGDEPGAAASSLKRGCVVVLVARCSLARGLPEQQLRCPVRARSVPRRGRRARWVTARTFFGLLPLRGRRATPKRAVGPESRRCDPYRRSRVIGLLAGLAGVVSTSNLYATSASHQAAASCGWRRSPPRDRRTSLFGGRGRIYQALLGSLVIASVHNGLGLLGQGGLDRGHRDRRDPRPRCKPRCPQPATASGHRHLTTFPTTGAVR